MAISGHLVKSGDHALLKKRLVNLCFSSMRENLTFLYIVNVAFS